MDKYQPFYPEITFVDVIDSGDFSKYFTKVTFGNHQCYIWESPGMSQILSEQICSDRICDIPASIAF